MGGSRSLSTDDPRSLTQLSPQLSFPRSCSPLTSCARRDVEREREQDFRVAVARPVTVARTILAERRIPSKRSTTSGGGGSLTQGRVTQRCKHARENCQKAVGSSPSLLSTSEAVEGARSARRCEKYEIRAAVRCPKYILRSWRKNGEGEGNEVDRVSLSLSRVEESLGRLVVVVVRRTWRVLGANALSNGREKGEEGSSWSLNVVLRACVRAYVRTPRACLVDVWERTAAARDEPGTRTPSRVVRRIETSPRRIVARRGGMFGGVGWSEKEGEGPCACNSHTAALRVHATDRTCVCAPTTRVSVYAYVCGREDAAARARAPLRARGRERGWLAHWRLTGGPTDRSVRRYQRRGAV